MEECGYNGHLRKKNIESRRGQLLKRGEAIVLRRPGSVGKNGDSGARSGMATKSGGRLLSASALIEGAVRDVNGKKLGEIEDFILDSSAGRIEYVVFSFGGLFGVGSRLCVVAPDALKLDEEHKCFRLNCDRKRVGNAPEFDKHDWPHLPWTAHPGSIYILCGKPHRRTEQRRIATENGVG